ARPFGPRHGHDPGAARPGRRRAERRRRRAPHPDPGPRAAGRAQVRAGQRRTDHVAVGNPLPRRVHFRRGGRRSANSGDPRPDGAVRRGLGGGMGAVRSELPRGARLSPAAWRMPGRDRPDRRRETAAQERVAAHERARFADLRPGPRARAGERRRHRVRRAPAPRFMSEPAVGEGGSIIDERFDRPLLIVSPPRSGSTLLFETMEQAPGLFSIGTESHIAIESIPDFHPGNRMWHSNRLTAAEAATPAARRLADGFYSELHDRDGLRPDGPVRMLEKTPKNALRIPFFAALWPDSAFIYLYRDVRQTLASMMEAWASGRFVTYPHLPGWTGYHWSLLLVPGWQALAGKPLPVVVAH